MGYSLVEKGHELLKCPVLERETWEKGLCLLLSVEDVAVEDSSKGDSS